MQGVRLNALRTVLLGKGKRKQDVPHLALSVGGIHGEFLRPEIVIGIVPANFSAVVRSDGANVDDSGGISGSGRTEDDGFEERHEQEVTEMVGAELRLEALLGADDRGALSDRSVVDHNL